MAAISEKVWPVVGMVSSSPLEPEDPDETTLTGVPSDVLVRVGRRAHIRGIVRAHVTRQQEPVTTDPGVHRDILLAVGAAVGDRVAHDPGAELLLVEQLSSPGVH